MSADAAPPAAASRSIGMGQPVHVGVAHRVVEDLVGGLLEDVGTLHRARVRHDRHRPRRHEADRGVSCPSLVERPRERPRRGLRSVDPDDDPLLGRRASACTRIVMDDRDRATRLLQHVLAHRADAQTEEAAGAAGPDHEQVGLLDVSTSARHGRSQTEMRPMVLAGSAPTARPPTREARRVRLPLSTSGRTPRPPFGRALVQEVPCDHCRHGEASGARPRVPPSAGQQRRLRIRLSRRRSS